MFFIFNFLTPPPPLLVLIVLCPLISVEAERIFSQLKIAKMKLHTQMLQDFLNALIKIRHDSNSFDEIRGTAVDAWKSRKQMVL